jgi:hypothetical protein
MKRALITENYGVQKSLIVLHPMKRLHTEILTNHLMCQAIDSVNVFVTLAT